MKKLDVIKNQVQRTYGVILDEKCRKSKNANAKYAFYQLSVSFTKASYGQMSACLSQDHSTVCYYLNNYMPDPKYDKKIELCYKVLKKHLGEPINYSYFESKEWLKKQLEILSNSLAELKLQKEPIKTDEDEAELIEIYKLLNQTKKKELIFKAKTTLKVQQKIDVA